MNRVVVFLGKSLLKGIQSINRVLEKRQKRQIVKQLNDEIEYEQNTIQDWINNSESPTPSYLLEKKKKIK